jgi:hypothetical protein
MQISSISKIFSVFLIVLIALSGCTGNGTIQVYFDMETPQHVFAAGDIESALLAKDYKVEFQDLLTLDANQKGNKIVIALGSDEKATSLMISQGTEMPEMGEQAYALRTTNNGGKTYWIIGGDTNGAMYGGLQIAENISFNGLKEAYNEEDSPFLKNRGIKFNIPLDKASPTYFYGHHGTAHKLAIKHVWDMDFWKTWFDEMARHRYNVLSLWSPHPFTSMLNMEDEYPGIANNGVIGFDENGNDIQVNNLSIDEKIEYWREIMRYGRERGFDIYFCNWNVFLSTAEGKHGLTFSTDNQKTKEYLKKCMIKFLETYPDLKGFGITVGERMGSLDYKQREEWAWDTFGMGMMEYALENPHRDLVFVHRQHDGNIDHILEHFAQLNDLPNVRFDLSCKYSEAHAHSTLTPSRWHRTGMEQGLGKYGIMSWLTIRNDDWYFLHWAEPQFVGDYIRGFPEVDKFVNAFYIGSDGWVFTKEFTSINPYYENMDALSIQRTWYMQKLWGRISYNPNISDEFFKNHLALRFPEVSVDKLFEAWSSASGAIRLANEQVTGKWQFDQDFWPEMWTGDNWKGNGRHFSIDETKEATPFAGSHLCTLQKTAIGECGDKTPAWENVEKIEKLAYNALDILGTLKAGSNTELQLTLKDITAQAYLGLYSAYKYRTVMHDIQSKQDEAREAMGRAYCYWKNYTDIMSELYIPVEMQRNKNFSSWNDYDDVVLLEYHKLGGVGLPECISK